MTLSLSKPISAIAMAFVTAITLMSASLTANAAPPVKGEQYYTAYNFMIEKERHVTTNYWRSELIPINSKVTVDKLTKKKMVLDIDGRKITILNIKKHSKRTMAEIAEEMLSPKKTSIRGRFKEDIKAGNLRVGMTKKQVIQTRGYPPAHKTPTTKSNLWVYWSSRFVQLSVAFEDGKLARARGVN